LFVPEVAELIAWGRLFGRAKDAERETLLRSLLPPTGGEAPLSSRRPRP